jgi:hypothetical protein
MRARWICLGLAILILGLSVNQGGAQIFGRKSTQNKPPAEP